MDIDALPTILDVVEMVSSWENELILPMVSTVPSSEYYDEGRYCYVSEQHNRQMVHLMPVSQSPFIFYRGQSRYHEPCIPTLYRGLKSEAITAELEVAANRIKICEFAALLEKHSVFQEVGRNLCVDPVALAQHYGLSTEYLDITNSKWVAAFFACTGYDSDTDSYYPVGRDYGEGYGVLYYAKFKDHLMPEEFLEKNGVIGYQYFARPTKQSSFGFRMEKGDDFNTSPYFEKIFFRHDMTASQIVYDMSYKQNRFIPKDELSKLAREIKLSNEVTRADIISCWMNYYQDTSPNFLDEACVYKQWRIREDNMPVVAFSDAQIEADWKMWNEYGRADIKSRILPIRPVAVLNL